MKDLIKKMRVFVLVITIMLCLGGISIQAYATETTSAKFLVSGDVKGSYQTLQQAVAACPANGAACTIKVKEDVVVNDVITIPTGKNIVITSEDIARPVSINKTKWSGRHFSVEGKLTIKDIVLNGEYEGRRLEGGVEVLGNFIMSDGAVITGCDYTYLYGDCAIYTIGGGAVLIGADGCFTMNGGIIDKNQTGDHGGGVYVGSGTFIMNDGSITNNYSGFSGGGVYVCDGAKFIMKGGLIKGNASQSWERDGVAGYYGESEIQGGRIEDLWGFWKSRQHLDVSVRHIKKVVGDKSFVLPVKLSRGDGKLTYTSDNEKVAVVDANGRVTVKQSGKADIIVESSETKRYDSEDVYITITVKPGQVKSVKVKRKTAKKAVVKWKKMTGISGYQIQCSTSKTFKKNVRKFKVKKAAVTSKTISRLKHGKKYYVRVRAYQHCEEDTIYDKSTTIYGGWSKIKTVKKK